MSGKLYDLGNFAFRKRWFVLIVWLLILATSITLMSIYQKDTEESFSIPGTESQVAFDKLEESFPQATGGSGRIVFAAPEGEQIQDYQQAVTTVVENVTLLKDVIFVASPLQTGAVSQDGRIALAQVQLKGSIIDVSEDLAPQIDAALDEARAEGLQVESGGDIIAKGPPESLVGVGEIIGVAVAALTLAVTFGALFAAGMPLLTAFIGVGIGVSSIFAASAFTEISTTTPTLAIMLGLAVGIDYALFIVTRHRKYLMEGLTAQKAAARAISTAGNAVVFAALTVVIALAALSVIGIPFVTTMGLAAAFTVAIAGTVAVTLIPAMLGFVGVKVLSKKQRIQLAKNKPEESAAQLKRSMAYRWGSLVTKKPFIPIFICVVLLAIIAIPAASLSLGFPGDSTASPDTTQRKAYDLTTEAFGAGFNGPILVVAELPEGLDQQALQMKLGQLTGAFMQYEGVVAAQPGGLSEDGRTAILQITPATGPNEQATKELVNQLRGDAETIAGPDTKVSLTGSVALLIDVDQKLLEALPKYLLVVVGLSFLILVVVFRSILIPLKATLGFLLTIAATFGALVAIFQWGWFGLFDPTPVVSFLPIIVIGIVFGLAMDYEFFLVSSMRESYVHEFKNDPKGAVVDGFVYGSRVVTAAAIIMISVFAGFITHHEQIIQMIGFALAFGILVDAFIVRMTIVPAVMAILGKSAWWIPEWLDKILPNVSIEGKEK